MTSQEFISSICILLLALMHTSSSDAVETKPNIVLIYLDDWAWNGSPIAMNPEMPNSRMPEAQMPNVQKLAEEGMVFNNAYGSPQCSPARACVLTGQSSARNGFTVFMNSRGQDYYDTSKQYDGFKVIGCIANETIDPNSTVGIPKALAPMGYVSAHIGKWHLRGDPGEHGYVLHDGDTNNNPGNTLNKYLKPGEEKLRRLPSALTDPKLMFSVTEKAIGFMEEQVRQDQPFYLQISHYAMHAGRECLPATREKYVDNPYVQAWYQKIGKTADTVNIKQDPAIWLGMVEDMDGRIGSVLDKLDELGITDKTYVIMVSDNGYRHEFLPELSQPLHARKWWVWEGGIRVPMIMKGPGITGGTRFTGNVVNYDFLPTFVDWAGGDVDQLENIDGVSLAPYLAGQQPDQQFLNRNLYFHYPHYRTTMPHTAVVSGKHKLLHFYGHEDIPMLFDLSEDVGEVHNIAHKHPQVHQKLSRDMMSYLDKVGGRIPKLNPDYQPEKYRAGKEYWDRINWGPFTGSRILDDDEREPTITLDAQRTVDEVDGRPRVEFLDLTDGTKHPEGIDLDVSIDVADGDGLQEIKLLINGSQVNALGKTSVPQFWSGFSDPLLKEMKPGHYKLEAIAKDKTGKIGRQVIEIQIGDPA